MIPGGGKEVLLASGVLCYLVIDECRWLATHFHSPFR